MLYNDKKRFLDFYLKSLNEYGDDPRSLHWIDEKSQNTRFEIFASLVNFADKSVLDVGCGFGDLFTFFLSRDIPVAYTGIDIIPEFIAQAKEKLPGINFKVEDIFSIDEEYDYVVACGALNFNVTDSKNYYFSMIKKMFECSKIGLLFNMLNNAEQKTDETYFSYNIEEVRAYCQTLTKNVTIISDYIPWDFTVYMSKE